MEVSSITLIPFLLGFRAMTPSTSFEGKFGSSSMTPHRSKSVDYSNQVILVFQ